MTLRSPCDAHLLQNAEETRDAIPASPTMRLRCALALCLFPLGCVGQSCGHETVAASAVPHSDEARKAQVPAPSAPARAAEVTMLKDQLMPLRRGGKTRTAYRPGDATERAAYGEFVSRLSAGDEPAPPSGYQLTRLEGDLLLLAERHGHERGSGALVIRRGASTPLILQAPHTFFDAGTLDISLHLFARLQATALLINTVHRASDVHDEGLSARRASARSGESSTDVAHQPLSFFSVAHASLVRSLPAATTVQLHGYADARLPQADAVVSAANTRLPLSPILNALRDALPAVSVAAYPADTRDLGGTGNAQAQICRDLGAPFLHLELSKKLRDQLLQDPETRAGLVEGLSALTR